MSDYVILRVNGREWGGWTRVQISAGIERLSRDFNVEITRQWPGESGSVPLQPRIKKGEPVEVLIGQDKVLTGWIEATPIRYDAKSIQVGISGRSKTADLIDCAANTTLFTGKTLYQIASALAKPFSIKVISQKAPKTPLQAFQADYGETVHEVLNKALGSQQALAWDDEDGNLLIGLVGNDKATTALVWGENILTCDTEQSIRERFSEYQVAGQRSGDDDDFGEATLTALRARARDSEITRYRPQHLQQSGNATGASCKARSDFEARQRAARTEETTYTVQGWRQGDGSLWKPNQRVIVFDPVLGFNNRELVISEVVYTQDEGGTLCELRVAPEAAYIPPLEELKAPDEEQEI
ncbi:phage baseplate assembly protein [Arsenophonus sp. PmNCSU2021_1]|uniref:phage baseplate assembly protein n=1 Tax=Arsenophonus sp. PmNCSU2021_1 TaxID=3118989 RepID=UPI002FEEA701